MSQGDVSFVLNGDSVVCPAGLTLAGALVFLSGGPARLTPRLGLPRAAFCGMGLCFDCVMQVDGVPGVRSCLTPVEPGMVVELQTGDATLAER